MAKCSVYKDYCVEHGFKHGAEAEELRKGIEDIISDIDVDPDEDSISALRERAGDIRDTLQRLLDRVNARDSLAYLEAQDDEDEDADEVQS